MTNIAETHGGMQRRRRRNRKAGQQHKGIKTKRYKKDIEKVDLWEASILVVTSFKCYML